MTQTLHTCIIAVGERGSRVLTAFSVSLSKDSTPCRMPCMVFSVWMSSGAGSTDFSFVSAFFRLSELKVSMPGERNMAVRVRVLTKAV